jgi:hypothetical protein
MKQSNGKIKNEEKRNSLIEGGLEGISENLEVDLSTLKSQIKEGLAGHGWIQQGPYLVCQSCPLKHATWIGIDRILTGFDENGVPILKAVNRDRLY